MIRDLFLKYILFSAILMTTALPSVASSRYGRKQLKELDEAIRNQEMYHEATKAEMRSVLAKMDTASSDSLKWVLAHRLYNGYHHYSLDSMYKYQRLMERFASTPAQKALSMHARVRVLLTRNEVDMARNVLASVDTSEISVRKVSMDYLRCQILVNSALAENASTESERVFYLGKVTETRLAYMRIDSTSFYSRRMMAMFYRDSGDVGKSLDILLGLYSRQDDEHNKASTAYNISKLYEMS